MSVKNMYGEAVCNICGLPFTDDEWRKRHHDADGEDCHKRCSTPTPPVPVSMDEGEQDVLYHIALKAVEGCDWTSPMLLMREIYCSLPRAIKLLDEMVVNGVLEKLPDDFAYVPVRKASAPVPLSMDEGEQEMLSPFRARIAELEKELEAAKRMSASWKKSAKENRFFCGEAQRAARNHQAGRFAADKRAKTAEALAEKPKRMLVILYKTCQSEAMFCPCCGGYISSNPEQEWHAETEDGKPDCELWAAVKDAMAQEDSQE